MLHGIHELRNTLHHNDITPTLSIARERLHVPGTELVSGAIIPQDMETLPEAVGKILTERLSTEHRAVPVRPVNQATEPVETGQSITMSIITIHVHGTYAVTLLSTEVH